MSIAILDVALWIFFLFSISLYAVLVGRIIINQNDDIFWQIDVGSFNAINDLLKSDPYKQNKSFDLNRYIVKQIYRDSFYNSSAVMLCLSLFILFFILLYQKLVLLIITWTPASLFIGLIMSHNLDILIQKKSNIPHQVDIWSSRLIHVMGICILFFAYMNQDGLKFEKYINYIFLKYLHTTLF